MTPPARYGFSEALENALADVAAARSSGAPDAEVRKGFDAARRAVEPHFTGSGMGAIAAHYSAFQTALKQMDIPTMRVHAELVMRGAGEVDAWGLHGIVTATLIHFAFNEDVDVGRIEGLLGRLEEAGGHDGFAAMQAGFYRAVLAEWRGDLRGALHGYDAAIEVARRLDHPTSVLAFENSSQTLVATLRDR